MWVGLRNISLLKRNSREGALGFIRDNSTASWCVGAMESEVDGELQKPQTYTAGSGVLFVASQSRDKAEKQTHIRSREN